MPTFWDKWTKNPKVPAFIAIYGSLGTLMISLFCGLILILAEPAPEPAFNPYYQTKTAIYKTQGAAHGTFFFSSPNSMQLTASAIILMVCATPFPAVDVLLTFQASQGTFKPTFDPNASPTPTPSATATPNQATIVAQSSTPAQELTTTKIFEQVTQIILTFNASQGTFVATATPLSTLSQVLLKLKHWWDNLMDISHPPPTPFNLPPFPTATPSE